MNSYATTDEGLTKASNLSDHAFNQIYCTLTELRALVPLITAHSYE